jgi:hypothetical protein
MSLKIMADRNKIKVEDCMLVRTNYCILLEGLQKIRDNKSLPEKARAMAQEAIDKAGEKFTPEMPFHY